MKFCDDWSLQFGDAIINYKRRNCMHIWVLLLLAERVARVMVTPGSKWVYNKTIVVDDRNWHLHRKHVSSDDKITFDDYNPFKHGP